MRSEEWRKGRTTYKAPQYPFYKTSGYSHNCHFDRWDLCKMKMQSSPVLCWTEVEKS